MEQTITPQFILRLPGISLKTYKPIEDTFDDRLTEKLEPPDATITYDKIPISFSGLQSWPKQTNLKCIMCDRTFKEVPKFYPKEFTKDTSGNIEFSPLVGYMCSFSCTVSYIDTLGLKRDELFSALGRLNFMYKIFTGDDSKSILRAPSKIEREEYGGHWDMEKFVTELKKVDSWIDLNHKIVERMENALSLNSIISNCVSTGQLNNEITNNTDNKQTHKDDEISTHKIINEADWEKAMNKKYDGTIVSYD